MWKTSYVFRSFLAAYSKGFNKEKYIKDVQQCSLNTEYETS